MPRTCDRIFIGGILFLIVLTPFAFGAVPLWAYTTMEVCVFSLVIVWMAKRAIVAREEHRAWSMEQRADKIRNSKSEIRNCAIPLALFIALCAFQLVPLPPSVLRAISPQTYEAYTQILPGWPESAPYVDVPQMTGDGGQETDRSLFSVSDQRSESSEQGAASSEPVASQPSRDAIQNPTPNTQHLRPNPPLLPPTWLPLSLSPNLGKIDLLRFIAFAALFFVVWRYPFEKPFEDFGLRNSTAGFFILSPEQRFLRSVVFAVLGTGLLVAVFAFIERFAGKGKILLSLAGYDSGASTVRASGPFINPDHFANYLSLILPLALGCALFRTFMAPKDNEHGLKVFCGFTTFLLFTGILLSLSRGGWINALFGVMVLVWLAPWGGTALRKAKRKAHSGRPTPNTQDPTPNTGSMLRAPGSKLSRAARLSLITLCTLLIVSLFLAGESGREQVDARLKQSFQPDLGLAERPKIWKDSLGIIRDFPLLGVGLGGWQDVFNHYESGPWSSSYFDAAHNDYIEILAETGAVGCAFLAWFFVAIGRRLMRGTSTVSTKNLPLLGGVLASLGGMALHSSLDFSLQIAANALLFTILLAIGLRVTGMAHRARRTNEGVEAMAPWELGDQRSTLNADWSEVTDAKTGHRRLETGRFVAGRNAVVRFGSPVAISALALVLIVCAVTQEEEPRRPHSIKEARERLLSRPFKASYHLSVIQRAGEQAPPEWQLHEYRAAQWIQPTNPYIRDQIAEILVGMGEREQALNEMTLSVAHAPSLQRHEYLSAKALPELSAEERDAVEAGFKQALAWNYPEAFQGLAEFYARQQRFADQAALYEQAALKETDSRKKPELLINAGVGYLKAGSRDQGAGEPEATGQRSEIRSQRSAVETGNETRKQRLETERLKNPKSEIQNSKFEHAERAFRAAIAASPTDPKPYQQLMTAVYGPKKDLPAATETVSEGIKAGTPPLALYLSLAEVAHRAGGDKERKVALASAKAEVEKSIRNGENPSTLYIAFADGARSAGDREQETAALLKALDLQPRSLDVLSRLAAVYFERQNFDRAALYLNRVAQIKTDSADVYFHLAVAEEGRYRFADAGRAYARAISLAPENKDYQKRYEEFQRRVDMNRTMDKQGAGSVEQGAGRGISLGG